MTSNGEQARNEGMDRAAAARKKWFTLASYTIDYKLAPLARDTGVPFTSEHLTALIGLPRKRPGRDRNNAVGSALGAASKRGTIEKVGLTTSKRTALHAATLHLWMGTGKTKRKRIIPRQHLNGDTPDL